MKRKKKQGEERTDDMYRFFFKRFLDILLSFMGIVVLAVPMLIIALIIVLDSKGPAIFSQDRFGKDGKPFKLYKFRSMKQNAPHDMATRDIDGQEYITKVGAFLRKTSLDELPQLFCILKGDMSIIGPRPVVLTETELNDYRKETGALTVRPGLTGLAQVEARDTLKDMKKKAELDGQYAKELCFAKDVDIFFKTIVKVLKQADIEEGGENPSGDEAETQAPATQTAETTRAQEGLERVQEGAEKKDADESAS